MIRFSSRSDFASLTARRLTGGAASIACRLTGGIAASIACRLAGGIAAPIACRLTGRFAASIACRLAGGIVAATLAFAAAACAPAPRVVVPDGAPRHPDGVAIDLPTAPPKTVAFAQASDGIVALETPLGPEAARNVVLRFFGAMVSEDRVTFQSLFSSHAKTYNPTTATEQDVMASWNRRFDSLDYQTLATTPLRQDSIELYRTNQWQRGSLGEDTQPTDVIAYFRVPQATMGRPLTGESISLQLRRVGDHYQIVRMTEDFAFP
jgi:hypothetical protein